MVCILSTGSFHPASSSLPWPVYPLGPVSPLAPVLPVAPVSPLVPVSPLAPLAPVSHFNSSNDIVTEPSSEVIIISPYS